MLAEVLGVLEEYLQETNMKYYVIPPIQWKATLKIAGKGRTAEKAAAGRRRPAHPRAAFPAGR